MQHESLGLDYSRVLQCGHIRIWNFYLKHFWFKRVNTFGLWQIFTDLTLKTEKFMEFILTWKIFKNLFVVNLVFNWKSLSKENCVPENFK